MKRQFVTSLAFLFLILSSVHSIAQQGVGINTRGVAPDSNAILDVSSTTKGALFPRMTTAQRTAIARPPIGLTVFDLDKRSYWYYAGTEWVEMTTNKDEWTSEGNGNSRINEDWNTQGNSNVGGEFLGTTNNQPLLFKTNGNERMRVLGNGNVGIGVQSPNELLEAGGSGRAFFGNGAGSNRAGLLIDGVEPNNASRIEAFNYGGGGSGRNLIINTSGGGNVGIGVTNPLNKTDIHHGSARAGSHATGHPLYVTGDIAADSAGIEFRHNNATQGIGFGYNTIYATGTLDEQDLGMKARGSAGNLKFITNNIERVRIQGNGNVGIGTATPAQKLHVNGSAFVSDSLGIDVSDPKEPLEVGGSGRAFFGDGQLNTRKGLLIDGVEGANASRIEAYDYGIPGGRNLIINTSGGGFVGINNPNPHAPLQFASGNANRKIVLSENVNNDHQVYGFGVNESALRYQVPPSATHIFYAGINSTTSDELMRIQANGNVGIDASDPKERLEVGGGGRAFFGDGAGDSRSGLLIDGVELNNASRIEAFNYDSTGGSGRNLIINTSGGGNVGIGIATPAQKLHVNGSAIVSENLGIGNSNPHVPLQFANDERNRKIVLWQGSNNDHEFSGFGINNSILRYQVVNENVDNVFYAGTSPTNSKELMRISGTGNVGIGNSNPHAPLHFANTIQKRKIVLWEGADNDHQFSGFGINNSILCYQVPGPSVDHVFYAATSSSSSNELMRISGWGFVGIGNSNPRAPLQFGNYPEHRKIVLYQPDYYWDSNFFFTGFGVGHDGGLRYQVPFYVAHVFYAGTSETSDQELMRIEGNGKVGIGTNTPTEKLDVNGNVAIAGSLKIGYVKIFGTGVSVPAFSDGSETCNCPSGLVAIGGGFVSTSHSLVAYRSYANTDSSWIVEGYNSDDDSHTFQAFVICARLAN